MSILDSITSNYEMMWKAFIRPKRQEYSEDQIMTEKCALVDGETVSNRFTYTLHHKDIKISCTLYTPLKLTKTSLLEKKMKIFKRKKNFSKQKFDEKKIRLIQEISGSKSCIVYLHSHTGCKLEGKYLINFLLEKNYSLCLFDFGGAGKSSGDYITLGWDEKDQTKTVISDLRNRLKFEKIGIWGKSMGAATSIFLCSEIEKKFRNNVQNCDYRIDALVLDSPFDKLRNVVFNIANEHSNIPGIILKGAMRIMKSTIQEKAKIDIYEINPIDYIGDFSIPALFVTGSQDYVVEYSNFMKMYRKYKGKKQIYIVDGGHADIRTEDKKFGKEVLKFFEVEVKEKNVVKKIEYEIEGNDFRVFRKLNNGKRSVKPNSSRNVREKKRNFSLDHNIVFQSVDEACDSYYAMKVNEKDKWSMNLSAKKFSGDLLVKRNRDYFMKNFKGVNNFTHSLRRNSNHLENSGNKPKMKKNPLNTNFKKDKLTNSTHKSSNSTQIAGNITLRGMEDSQYQFKKNSTSREEQISVKRISLPIGAGKGVNKPSNIEFKRSTTSPTNIQDRKHSLEKNKVPKLKFYPPSKPQDEFKNSLQPRNLTRIDEEEEKTSQIFATLSNRYNGTRSSHISQSNSKQRRFIAMHDSLCLDSKNGVSEYTSKYTENQRNFKENYCSQIITGSARDYHRSRSIKQSPDMKTKRAYETVKNTLQKMKETGEFSLLAKSDYRVKKSSLSAMKEDSRREMSNFFEGKKLKENVKNKSINQTRVKNSGYFVGKRIKQVQEKKKKKSLHKFKEIFSDLVGKKGKLKNNNGVKKNNKKDNKRDLLSNKKLKLFKDMPKLSFQKVEHFPKIPTKKKSSYSSKLLSQKFWKGKSELRLEPNLSRSNRKILQPKSSKYSHQNSLKGSLVSNNPKMERLPLQQRGHSLESKSGNSLSESSNRKHYKNSEGTTRNLFQQQFIQNPTTDSRRGESAEKIQIQSRNGNLIEIKKLNIGPNIYKARMNSEIVSSSRRYVNSSEMRNSENPGSFTNCYSGMEVKQNQQKFQNVYNNQEIAKSFMYEKIEKNKIESMKNIRNGNQILNQSRKSQPSNKHYIRASRVYDSNRVQSRSNSRYNQQSQNRENSAYFLDSIESSETRNQLISQHFSTNRRRYCQKVSKKNKKSDKLSIDDKTKFGSSVSRIIKSLKQGGALNSSNKYHHHHKSYLHSKSKKKPSKSKTKGKIKSGKGITSKIYTLKSRMKGFGRDFSTEANGGNNIQNKKSGYLGDFEFGSMRSLRETRDTRNVGFF